MVYTETTAGYKPRRYGKPWIARVTGWEGNRPLLEWGTWVSDGPGTPGELRIKVQAGDLIYSGQRDLRRPDKTENYWAVIEADGSTRPLDSKVEALHYWEEYQATEVSNG